MKERRQRIVDEKKKKMEDKMLRLMKRGKNEAKLNNVVGWEMNEILIHNI